MTTLLPFPANARGPDALPQTRAPAILGLRFGDGYRQECQDGISGEKVTQVQVSWSKLTTPEKIVIDLFFEERSGDRFYYTLPGDTEPMVYICKTWTPTVTAFGVWNIEATWDRVPDTDGLP